MRELYMNKENRDRRARELKAQGRAVRRSSQRGVQLHPEYVKDWDGEVERGVGNMQYRTFFPVIYEVSWPDPNPWA